MSGPVPPAALDEDRPAAAVLPVYLGLYLVLLAFFVYFVAASAAERQKEAAVADDLAAGIVQPVQPVAVAVRAPALRPLAEVFRPLALPGVPGDWREPDRFEATVPPERMFTDAAATLRPDFAPVLDRVARALTAAVTDDAAAAAPAGGAASDDRITLQLLIGLPAIVDTAGTDAEPASVAEIVAERLAVGRAASLARALLARGVPPETFAVGVAPGAGNSVRFLFRLDPPHAAAPPRLIGGAPLVLPG